MVLVDAAFNVVDRLFDEVSFGSRDDALDVHCKARVDPTKRRWEEGRSGSPSRLLFDDPPRSWPDEAYTTTSIVSELEQQGAAEGKSIVTMTGRRYLLGKAATHASLAAERDDAQREADALREQLEALQAARPALVAAGVTQKKRPRGRAPAGYCWDEQKCGWFDENGKPFELVDHPSRKRLAAEKRTAVMEDSPWARV